MRISDWSSDVCSSDLHQHRRECRTRHAAGRAYLRRAGRSDLSVKDACDGVGAAQRARQLHRAGRDRDRRLCHVPRSEEHTSELQSLMRISYAVFCLKKKKDNYDIPITTHTKHNNIIKVTNTAVTATKERPNTS